MSRELARDDSQACFDELPRLQPLLATVEIVSSEIGGQTEAEHMPLSSLSYDDERDVITVAVGGRDQRYPVVLWHTLERPTRLQIREEGGRPNAMLGGVGERHADDLAPHLGELSLSAGGAGPHRLA